LVVILLIASGGYPIMASGGYPINGYW
jgi:hypothetical protein